MIEEKMIDDELDVDALTQGDIELNDILDIGVQKENESPSYMDESEPQNLEENTSYEMNASEALSANTEYSSDVQTENNNPVVAEKNMQSDVDVLGNAYRTQESAQVQNEGLAQPEDYYEQPQDDTSYAESNVFVEEIGSSGNSGYLRWYSGNASDNVYEFGKESQSGNFTGSDDCRVIHVNVGYDTYGWTVHFENGTVMNLRDVREYQIRNGSLPSASGKIVFGNVVLTFAKVEKIVIYERVRYFSYGV